MTAKLSLLYVGEPGTVREKSFVDFLEQKFASVRTASLADIGSLELSGIDVTVIDGEPTAGTVGPPERIVPQDLPTATVLIGGVGGKVADAMGLKLGWSFGCLCLNHQAIVEDTAHVIFEGPFEVPTVETTAIEAPENFAHFAPVKTVAATYPVAEMFTPEEPATDFDERIAAAQAAGDMTALMAVINEAPTPGLVTTSAGFFDSPDMESILGGINQKAHDYVAVGRHARFTQWGFHGDPSVMSPLGQALFANTIVYAAKFTDAPILAKRVQLPRAILELSLNAFGQAADTTFRDGVPAGFTTGPEADNTDWWTANRGYVRQIGSGRLGSWVFDTDLAEFGIANDDLALLDRLADGLDAEGEAGDRARKLWDRYVKRPTGDAAGERAWLAEHREQLFFSDWAGYRWISPNDLPELIPSRAIGVTDGSVTMHLSAHRGADGQVTAELSFRIQDGWYLYSPSASDGIPVAVAPTPGATLKLAALPEFPVTDDGHLTQYFALRLALKGDGTQVSLDVTLQPCDAQQCLPPATITVTCTATTE